MKDVHQIAHICAFLLIAPLVKNLLTAERHHLEKLFQEEEGLSNGQMGDSLHWLEAGQP